MHLHNIHYRPRRGVFHADVMLNSGSGDVLVPCEIPAAPQMSPDRVIAHLQRRALKISRG